MRIVWVGAHREGVPALRGALERGHIPELLVTLDAEVASARSGSVDYAPMAAPDDIPLLAVPNINDAATVSAIREVDPDLLVVLGWGQILKRDVLTAAHLGAVGSHASLLPHNRGSAPVNWAIIRGETCGGNTLMWLAEDVDRGAVIDQRDFPITEFDTCASVYDKVAATNRDMLLPFLDRLSREYVPGIPQELDNQPLLPRRRPHDGLIDWSHSAKEVYDFVRGLTKPYPGAFTTHDGEKLTVWEALLTPGACDGRPGQVVGPVISPREEACGVGVVCGDGGVVGLLELQRHEHTVSGRRLCSFLPMGAVLGR